MSNASTFNTQDNVVTVDYRVSEWSYDPKGHETTPDFKVYAKHDRGAEPHKAVNFEVYVGGRQSNEIFSFTRQDVIALRDMFAQVASTMCDE